LLIKECSISSSKDDELKVKNNIKKMKFNWKEYIKSRPDLKKNWNGPVRAWIHYHSFLHLDKIIFNKKEPSLKSKNIL